MRVIQLVRSFSCGGRLNAVTSLIAGLRSLNVENLLCSLEETPSVPEEICRLGVRVEVLGRRSLFDLAAAEKVRSFCRGSGIDIVHTHEAGSQFTAALARFATLRIPLLLTFHRSSSRESDAFVDRVRNSLACLQCGAVVTGSRERHDYFLKRTLVSRRKMVVIPFGTDLSRFNPDSETRSAVRQELGFGPEVTVVGTVGHFGPIKGVDVAIRAVQCLAGRRLPKPVAMVILGDGPERGELKQLAGSGKSPGPIRFVGFRRDVNRYMCAFDVLLHTPRQEAFGLVVIEAMATGLPVVASRVGGIPDLVRDGSTGFLVAPERPEAFADALERLWSHPANGMGQEARRVAMTEYSNDVYARRHIQLYENLLAGRSPQLS